MIYIDKLKSLIEKHIVVIAMAIGIIIFRGRCLIKEVIGIPCPSCGITRAYKAFINLDFEKAFRFNPLFLFIPIVILIFIYGNKPLFGSNKKQILFISIVVFIMVWVYIYRLYNYFPNIEPMDYNYDSILWRTIEHIKR